jgi:hypothetical protein
MVGFLGVLLMGAGLLVVAVSSGRLKLVPALLGLGMVVAGVVMVVLG